MKERYALITGASSGIGFATAKAFARRGFSIIAVARRLDRLETLDREIRAANPSDDLEVMLYKADLSDANACRKLYEDVRNYPIKVWMNNAGRGNEGDILAEDIDRDLEMLDLNCRSVFLLSTLYARDHADESDATLINVSSVGGYAVFPGSTFYCATKYFVSAFSEGLAQELASKGHPMRVKILAPAATETEFEQAAHNSDEKVDYTKKFSSFTTADRMAEYVTELYDSDKTVFTMDFSKFQYVFSDVRHPNTYRTATDQIK